MSSSSPIAGPSSSRTEAEPLPPKAQVWPLNAADAAQRSSSQRSTEREVPTAAEAEARLDARLDVPLPPQPAAASSSSSSQNGDAPQRRRLVPRALRLGVSNLPRLPVPMRSTSLAIPPPPRPPTPPAPAERGPKTPARRLHRILPHLILWIVSAGLLAGTGIGYFVAIVMNARQQAQQAAAAAADPNPPPPPSDPSNSDSNDPNSSGDDNSMGGLSSTAFLHTFFLLGLAFELVFLYRRTRALYVAWFYDPYYWFAPEALQTSSTSRIRPSSHARADNPTPSSDELKRNAAKRWARRAVEWVLRVRPEKLRPRDEVLPSYVAALEVPGGWDEVPGQRARMTREERRLARTGSARGTGDVEDIEVERAWRLGGGRGLPNYNSDEVRQSVILLSGPMASFPADAAGPQSPTTPASFTRLSRRVSDSFGRLSRRISAGLGIAPTTPISPHAQGGVSSARLSPAPSPKPRLREKGIDDTPSPIRHAHHASVVLDLAHEFEVEADEKEALEADSRRTSMAAGPSGVQYASYIPRSSVSLEPATTVSSPRRTSWTNAHHRRRSSSGGGSLAGPLASPAPTSRLATVHESVRPSMDEQEVVV